MSGRLILNLETVFALATVLLLLWRCKPSGWSPVLKPRFSIDTSDALRMASVAILTTIVFWPALNIYFLSDDFVLVSMSQVFHATFGPGSYATMFTHGGGDGFFRPLGYSSLFWASQWAGLDPVRWHSAGLALHIVNALLVFVLAGAIGLPRAGAWLASGLFALHGAHPEAVVWIAGRFDVLATFFVLIALVAFIRFWESPSLLAGVIAALAMTLGILSKESAYATPLMMLVFVTSREASWKRRIKFLAPFVLLAAALFAYRWTLQGGIGGYLTAEGKPQILTLSALSIAKALGLRLWTILFFPIDWAVGASAWLVVILLLYAATWIALATKPRGLHAGLLLPLGFILAAAIPPVQQLLIGADLEKSRLLYLPSVGFCLFAAAVVDSVGPLLRFAAAGAMLAFNLTALTHNLTIWQDVAGKSKTVCEALAACDNPNAAALPRILNGVYFFANGLPECIRLQRSQNPGMPTHACPAVSELLEPAGKQ